MKKQNIHIKSANSFLLMSIVVSNFLNFIFNAILGRVLSFEELGVLTLLNSLWFLIQMFSGPLSSTVNHRIAYLSTKTNKSSGAAFFQSIQKQILFVVLSFSIIWILCVPFLSGFFKIENSLPLLLLTPVFFIAASTAIYRGYLQGSFRFMAVGNLNLFEAGVKLFAAIALVVVGLQFVAYVSIFISIIFTFLLSVFVVYKGIDKTKATLSFHHFPKKFYFASLLTNLSTAAFLNIDILLVKHFFSPTLAGQYALLSLVGKMVFFFGSLFNTFMISYVARSEGENTSSYSILYRIFFGNAFLVLTAYVILGEFGYFFTPILFGSKAQSIVPYLGVYTLAIALYTLSNTIALYHLAKQKYLFSVSAISSSFVLALGIIIFHESINQVIYVLLFTSYMSFFLMIVLSLTSRNGRFFLRTIIDFLDAFLPLEPTTTSTPNGKRILIFNWRDTKHTFAGGAEVYINELAKRWVAKGNSVTLFCGNDGNAPRNETIDNVKIIRRGGFYFVYIWAFLYYIIQFRGKYDVIIDCENGIPFFTPLYAKEKKFLVIHHIHQEVFRKSLVPPFSYIASFLEIKVMPIVYKNIQIITVSQSSAKEILEHSLTSLDPVVAYNGVDTTIFKPGEKNLTPQILYLGRLKYYKSLNVFLRTAKKVLERIPTAEFVIAGDGEEKENLKKFARKLGIFEKVTFLGKVSEEEKIKLYQKAWVFVNPSFMEGWGITTIEANACGTPVVASNVPGLKDSVKNPHSGFLVPYGNVNAFSRKVSRLIIDTKMRSEMSKEATLWAKKFDWEKSADTCLKLISV